MPRITIAKDILLLARDLRIEKGWRRVIGRDEIIERAEMLFRFSAIPEITLPSFDERR